MKPTLKIAAQFIGCVGLGFVLGLLLFGCSSPSSGGYNQAVTSLWQTATTNYVAYITGSATNLVPVLTPVTADTPIGLFPALTNTVIATSAPVPAWPAYWCGNFFVHGQPNEDTIRETAFSSARAQNLDCIECEVSYGMDDELAMHLLKLQHPDIPGYYLRLQRTDGWFFKAQRAGIVRWIHSMNAPTMEQAKRWLWLVKDYAPAELQLKISGSTAADVQQFILNNTNKLGVVIETGKARASRKRSFVGDATTGAASCLFLGWYCNQMAIHDAEVRR